MVVDDERGEQRVSIEERAKRRDRIVSHGSDRYASLLHALQAGRDVSAPPRRRTRVNWHPIARKLLLATALVVSLYLVATVSLRLWRESTVDTWTGPDATVTSGQKLAGCAALAPGYDDVFPRWVRFEGRMFLNTGFVRPVGSNDDGSYVPTAYTLRDIELFRITDTPAGRDGSDIMLKLTRVETGVLFREAPECA